MYISFKNISSAAKVWIYQIDRKLSPEEEQAIANDLKEFLEGWNAHQQPLKCSFEIFHLRFIVIAVDENYNAVSGCSIDSSVNFLHQLEEKYHLNLFDRNLIAFMNNEGEVYLEPLMEVKEKIRQGLIDPQEKTFNNLVKDKKEFEEQWVIPAAESWMKRYFKIPQ